jgi:hypothetical protein
MISDVAGLGADSLFAARQIVNMLNEITTPNWFVGMRARRLLDAP